MGFVYKLKVEKLKVESLKVGKLESWKVGKLGVETSEAKSRHSGS
jgi:hypothetical protein